MKVKGAISSSRETPSQKYRVSPAVWNHTGLPVTRYKGTRPTLTPASWYSIYLYYPGGMEGWVELSYLTMQWPKVKLVILPSSNTTSEISKKPNIMTTRMSGNVKCDGCLLGWSKLWSNFSPLVDQSLPKLSYVSARVIAVCNAVFRLTISCCVPEISAISRRDVWYRAKILMFLGRQTFWESDPKFLTNFINLLLNITDNKWDAQQKHVILADYWQWTRVKWQQMDSYYVPHWGTWQQMAYHQCQAERVLGLVATVQTPR